jgi:hypothetical protein
METAELLKGSRGREVRRGGAGCGNGPLQLRDPVRGIVGEGSSGRIVRHSRGRQLVDDSDDIAKPPFTVGPREEPPLRHTGDARYFADDRGRRRREGEQVTTASGRRCRVPHGELN